jgi:DNA-binding response OmpR family regulator
MEQPTANRVCILVVEDDPLLRTLYTYAFDNRHEVYMAEDVKQGWALFVEKSPKIVFLDIMLHQSNGHDLARMIKKRSPETVVIMSTSSKFIDDKKEAANNHVDGFMTKPFNRATLSGYVDWCLRS